jgi:hypothetical protein
MPFSDVTATMRSPPVAACSNAFGLRGPAKAHRDTREECDPCRPGDPVRGKIARIVDQRAKLRVSPSHAEKLHEAMAASVTPRLGHYI